MNNIYDELDKLSEKENIERMQIRLSGKKKVVDRDTFAKKFSPGFCGTCMNYDDFCDKCKFGISIYEVQICELWDDIYTTQSE